jgi:plasmid maintenance system antidote protein VapI
MTHQTEDPLAVLRSMAHKAGSQKELARKLGYTSGYLSDVLNHRRNVTDEMLIKIGLRRIIVRAK